MKPIYQVKVFEMNCKNADGSLIVIWDCGHNHRTLSGVNRCCNLVQRLGFEGFRSTFFYNAEIVHSDNSHLTHTEQADLVWMPT